ncbi:hypothetical protein D3C71_447460 [compost metagenome]
MDDELGDQGIVMGGNPIARCYMGIDPHAGAARQVESRDQTGAGNEAVGIFGIDAALDRVSLADDVLLRNFQRMAESDEKLLAHQIHARGHFRDRMFDLQTGVHLDEVEFTVFVEKLEGADAAITDLAAGFNAAIADKGRNIRRDADGRTFLDDFLVAALHRAVAQANPDAAALAIAENLNFDMARMFEKFFDIEFRRSECAARLFARDEDGVLKGGGVANDAHAAPAAAAGCLDDDGIADLSGDFRNLRHVIRQGGIGAGNAGHAGLHHRPFCRDLVAHGADGVGTWADENRTRFLNRFRKRCPFGEKTITGVNSACARQLHGKQDSRHVEIALAGRSRADADGGIGRLQIIRILVRFRIDHDGLQAEFTAGALHAECDFAAIGDEDAVECPLPGCFLWKCCIHHSNSSTGCPSSTSSPSLAMNLAILPLRSALTVLNTFIASMMKSSCPSLTSSPASAKGAEPGLGARWKRPNEGAATMAEGAGAAVADAGACSSARGASADAASATGTMRGCDDVACCETALFSRMIRTVVPSWLTVNSDTREEPTNSISFLIFSRSILVSNVFFVPTAAGKRSGIRTLSISNSYHGGGIDGVRRSFYGHGFEV